MNGIELNLIELNLIDHLDIPGSGKVQYLNYEELSGNQHDLELLHDIADITGSRGPSGHTFGLAKYLNPEKTAVFVLWEDKGMNTSEQG